MPLDGPARDGRLDDNGRPDGPATSPDWSRRTARSSTGSAARCSAIATKATTPPIWRGTSTATCCTGPIGPSSTTISQDWAVPVRRGRSVGCRGWRSCDGTPIRSRSALDLPAQAVAELGAPARVELVLRPAGGDALEISLVMREKPANRMPEASFVTFTPAGAGAWDYRKMGLWQKANRVAPRGGGQLQAVTAVRTRLAGGPAIEVVPFDTPLVAPAETPFMVFAPSPPSLDSGDTVQPSQQQMGHEFSDVVVRRFPGALRRCGSGRRSIDPRRR